MYPPISDRPSILALLPLSSAFSTALSAKFNLIQSQTSSPSPHDDSADSVRAVLISGRIQVDSDFLDRYPDLKLVQTDSAGLNHINLEECARRGIHVANAGEVYSKDVADYAVGLLLDVSRKISAGDRYIRHRSSSVQEEGMQLGYRLGGKRVGIVGLGSIGSAIAKRLQAFGCKIFYLSRKPKPNVVNYKYIANICDLATESDILVVSCSLTKETHHIINKQVLQALGKEGIIINIGRGATIDEPELVRCLVRGEIKGVGLDVYENEPKVPTELIQMENVVLTPHRAIFTPDAFADVIQVCIANFEAFFAGKPLITPVVDY